MRQRRHTVNWYRENFSRGAYVATLVALAWTTRKSRKVKEYLRAIIRAWRSDPDGDDFVYWSAQAALKALAPARGKGLKSLLRPTSKTAPLPGETRVRNSGFLGTRGAGAIRARACVNQSTL